MTHAEVRALLKSWTDEIDGTDAGAMLIVTTGTGGPADLEYVSNLSTADQLKILRAVDARIRGAQ